MNVSSALHHVLKAWQCDSKAVPPEQLQVTPVHLTKYNGFEIYRYSQNLICTCTDGISSGTAQLFATLDQKLF